jgi:hypothetical protein
VRLGLRPARARPSWIIRGACPLLDLMEVRKLGCECGATSRQDLKRKKTKSFTECKNPQKKSQFICPPPNPECDETVE